MAKFDDPAFCGDRWADVYDEQHAWLDPAAAVEFLTGLARDGKVLELGIGTGRVALPLAARGIAVQGVDASPAMVARLRDKPGGETIPVTVGDMTDMPVKGPFQMVYLTFNGLFSLTTQERQVECFRKVARVLEPGGTFVIECFVPDPSQFERGQRVVTRSVTEDSAAVELAVHDAAAQRITSQMVIVDEKGMHLRPVIFRYCWPAELDLMAQLADLRLRQRYGGWDKRPYDSSSTGHVSVYQRN